MFDFKKLINATYLFDINTIMLTRSDKLIAGLGVAFVVLAILFKLAAIYAPTPVDKGIRNRFYKLFLTIGLLEVVWFGARWENIRFFGSHFIAFLMLLIGLVWFIMLAISAFKHYRADKVSWEKEQVKMKYLPK